MIFFTLLNLFRVQVNKNSCTGSHFGKYLHRRLRIKKSDFGDSLELNEKTPRVSESFFVIRIGFKPMACCLEGSCSIQLSYRTDIFVI